MRYFLLLVVAAACHAAPAAVPHSTALFHPDSASMNTPCPHTYTVLFQTTKGNFEVQVEQAWAPNGAQRFYNLVKNGEQGCECCCRCRCYNLSGHHSITDSVFVRILQRRCLLPYRSELYGPIWHSWEPEACLHVARYCHLNIIALFFVQATKPSSPDADIHDDKVVESNKPGYITFATAGPNTRTTQVNAKKTCITLGLINRVVSVLFN